MADDANKAPAEADKAEDQVPQVSTEDKPKEAEALSQDVIPENLKDKSAEDIAKMYVNLEKKLGEQSGEVKQARDVQEKMNVVLQAIWRNPDLYRSVESEIQKISRGEDVLTDRTPTNEDGSKEAGKQDKKETKVSDERRYLESQIISDFQKKVGLDKLSLKERQELMQKVSTAWANMLDPKGKKTKQELLRDVELDVLPQQLENAYWLTQKDSLVDQGKLHSQDFASMGNIPTGSGRQTDGVELTAKEKETADKLGIPHEKYLKQKQQIENNK